MSNKRRFQDLTIRDNFIFAAVMMQEDNCKRLLDMGDECRSIFLSTVGKDEESIPKELKAFLKFVKEDTSENNTGTDDAYVRKLQETIRSVKENRELESSFMTWEDIRQESKAEGIKESIFLLLGELGQISESTEETILFENRMSILKVMLKKANQAKSIEEFEEQISNL